MSSYISALLGWRLDGLSWTTGRLSSGIQSEYLARLPIVFLR